MLKIVDANLGGWIIGQYKKQLHPAKYTDPGAVERQDQWEPPSITLAEYLNEAGAQDGQPLPECGFVQDDFRPIFPELRK